MCFSSATNIRNIFKYKTIQLKYCAFFYFFEQQYTFFLYFSFGLLSYLYLYLFIFVDYLELEI